MNGLECYWNVELPKHFIVEHPIGTVLGRAKYGDYFCAYQGVTVGASFEEKECVWPILGDFVTMYANSSVIGRCHIGNNVIIAANAFLYDEDIPDNSVVFGSSPNLTIKSISADGIRKKLIRIWNFDKI